MKKNPQAFEWDYAGACAPGSSIASCHTFSVGIFQWLPRASRKGLKRGKVVKRIRGYVSAPDEVYRRAEEFIAHLGVEKGEQ